MGGPFSPTLSTASPTVQTSACFVHALSRAPRRRPSAPSPPPLASLASALHPRRSRKSRCRRSPQQRWPPRSRARTCAWSCTCVMAACASLKGMHVCAEGSSRNSRVHPRTHPRSRVAEHICKLKRNSTYWRGAEGRRRGSALWVYGHISHTTYKVLSSWDQRCYVLTILLGSSEKGSNNFSLRCSLLRS